MKKRYKVKKAVNGLQDISIPEQGSYSNVLSSGSSFASAGASVGGTPGAIIGGIAGLGLGYLQKSKQDAAYKFAKATNLDRKMNRAYTGDEDTISQGIQRFKKGGKVSTKVIEIEGKKAPEIHTDKNFNLKNLGTTPHSKGGDKVHAEEGDIVFPTQNSLVKYNKITAAIQEGDHTTLHKEKNKLPEDKGMKNQDGNKGVKRKSGNLSDYLTEKELASTKGNPTRFKAMVDSAKVRQARANAPRDYMMEEQAREAKGLPKPAYMSKPKPVMGQPRTSNVTGYELPSRSSQPILQPKISGNLDMSINPGAFDLPARKNYVSKDPAFEGYKLPGKVFPTPAAKKANTQGKQVRKTTPITSIAETPQVGKFTTNATMNEPDLTDLKNRKTVDQVAESAKGMNTLDASSKAISSPSTGLSTSQKGQGLNNALQFAGVANNLFQGLKGEKSVDEQYYNPDKIKYTDRSQGLRKQSSQAATVGNTNARNLAGGNIGNIRANMNANRVADLDRQGSIDEREQGRADAIQAQNTEIGNQAKQINLGRRDQYQQIGMQTRAAKQGYIDQAASDIGQYGMAKREESYLRSRDDKAEAAQVAGYNSINGRYQHKSNLDGSTYFEGDAGSAITRYGNGSGVAGKRKRFGLFAKGTKSVNTKYKMK